MEKNYTKKATFIFGITFLIIVIIFLFSIFRTNEYNYKNHRFHLKGEEVLDAKNEKDKVDINTSIRSSTWGKIFDFNNEGLTENNYRAYTYDFMVRNNTRDKVEKFSFKLIFNKDAYLSSAWNGSVEIHQNVKEKEYTATVADMREFNKENYKFETFTVDGEQLIHLKPGDYIIYHPSSSMNAMEMPIEAYKATVPGMIIYVDMKSKLNFFALDLQYKMHRILPDDLFFWIAFVAFLMWMVILVSYIITSMQLKKYKVQHEHDSKVLNESIETFTGFIDAKDPYTNGHSTRVAIYTKLIAKAMGYDKEELERIYYIALLHDCGKIGVPDSILGKPSKLTDEEYEIIKSHTVRGGQILERFKSLKDVELGALYHHERYDGRGYPEGIAGDEIPLIARMICVADSYDAMNSNRVYRRRLDKEAIIQEIEKNKGLQFDPVISEIFLKILRNGEVDKATEKYNKEMRKKQ